jgi:preprotein translocase subunit SecE
MEVKSVATTENQSAIAGIAGWPAAVKNYFEELQAEMRKVTWPSWKQVQATTTVVIASVFIFAAYFALVDMIIGRSITTLFKTLGK